MNKYEWWKGVLNRNPSLCSFDYEPDLTDRGKPTLPCTERYRAGCGCRTDGKPFPRRKWKRQRV